MTATVRERGIPRSTFYGWYRRYKERGAAGLLDRHSGLGFCWNRILKRCDLITSPAYIVMSASDHFQHPTRRVNELWKMDFTRFRVVG